MQTLLALKKGAKYSRTVAAILKTAHALQIRNWIISWMLPEAINTCSSSLACSESSNLGILTEYRGHAAELLSINNQLAAMFTQIGKIGKAQIQIANGNKIYEYAMSLAESVPESTSVCTPR